MLRELAIFKNWKPDIQILCHYGQFSIFRIQQYDMESSAKTISIILKT